MRLPFVLPFLLLCLSLHSQTLVRKALVGLYITETASGLRIDSIAKNSSAANLNLRKDDILKVFNSEPVTSREAYEKAASAVRAGDELAIEVARGGKKFRSKGMALARPLEHSAHADVIYDWVRFRDGYLRTITRRPKGQTKVPAILLIPGYGCGSIENFSKSYNGALMNEWLKNGYAVVTIEKSGIGDSYGCIPCSEADLATDIESFEAGYRFMQQLEFVDPAQLYIWGHSLGGMIAPEIAKKHQPKGVMVFGTVFRPWNEFLPEMHRVQKPLLENKSYLETEMFLRKIEKVYYEFFVLKKTRDELYSNPDYRDIVVSELEHKPGSTNMWGRHWRFWQQIDSLNLADSWSRISCPVLVINGGADYEQCAPIEPILIEETVNASHPGNATRIQINDLDHFMMKSESYRQAVDNFRTRQFLKGNFHERIATETVNWLNKQTGKS